MAQTLQLCFPRWWMLASFGCNMGRDREGCTLAGASRQSCGPLNDRSSVHCELPARPPPPRLLLFPDYSIQGDGITEPCVLASLTPPPPMAPISLVTKPIQLQPLHISGVYLFPSNSTTGRPAGDPLTSCFNSSPPLPLSPSPVFSGSVPPCGLPPRRSSRNTALIHLGLIFQTDATHRVALTSLSKIERYSALPGI